MAGKAKTQTKAKKSKAKASRDNQEEKPAPAIIKRKPDQIQQSPAGATPAKRRQLSRRRSEEQVARIIERKLAILTRKSWARRRTRNAFRSSTTF